MSAEHPAAQGRRSRRWWFVQTILGASFLIVSGWTHWLGGAEWLNNVLMIVGGFGLCTILVELERGRRGS